MLYNQRPVMGEIHANRRLWLRQLIEERFGGNRTALARAVGLRPSYTSCFTEIFAGRANLGNRTASRIEQALGLPNGWMDTKPPPGAPKTPYKARMGTPPKVRMRALKEMLAEGLTQRETAQQLGVHESTVSHALKRARAAEKKHKHKRPQTRVAA